MLGLMSKNTKILAVEGPMIFAVVMAMFVILCSPSFGDAETRRRGDTETVAPSQMPGEIPEYIIGPGDVIQISVWQYDEFNGTMTVGPDGKITMNLLGDIPIAGLTREETRKDIAERLSNYIKEGAQVTVAVVQFNSQKVSVFGQVANPSTIAFSSPPSLVEIMVQSGPTADADLTAVKIIPADSSIREPITVNMVEVFEKGDTSQLPRLHPGDTVYVPKIETVVGEDEEAGERGSEGAAASASEEQFVIHIMGAVARPGSFVSSEEPTLTQALIQAGSVTDSMAMKDVRVIRSKQASPSDDRVVHVDLDKYLVEGDTSLLPRLYSGDTIYVPTVTEADMKDISIRITGEVLRPGSYRTSEPLDILDAISMAGGLTPNANPEMIKVSRESADSYEEKIVNIDEFLEDIGSASPPEMVEPGYRIYVPAKHGSAARIASVATRGIVAFLADLIPIYGLWRLITD